mgnify:CR=1 FL=1
MTPQLMAGEEFELKTGGGVICASFRDCDRVKGNDTVLKLCQPDAELIGLLTGMQLFTQAGSTIGGKIPATKRVCVSKVRCAGHPITCTFEHGNGRCAEIRFSRKTHQDVDFHLVPLLIPNVRESVLVIPTADIVKG